MTEPIDYRTDSEYRMVYDDCAPELLKALETARDAYLERLEDELEELLRGATS